ncbi:MAG: LLM class flavin-dependent oxidoreductase [Gammaproteobacteria bacterium]|nr:LLM class flavin-dependent oxidoreductase [Gammaproteobacteria bacterium]
MAHPDIPIHLGAIGPQMSTLAGECTRGVLTHPTNTAARYIREVMLGRIAQGARRAQRAGASAELVVAPLYATGRTAGEIRERPESVASSSQSTSLHRNTGQRWNSSAGGKRASVCVSWYGKIAGTCFQRRSTTRCWTYWYRRRAGTISHGCCGNDSTGWPAASVCHCRSMPRMIRPSPG